MRINVLKKMEYRRVPVYIRHFQYVFEYVIIWKKELYTIPHVFRPAWYRRVLPEKYQYTEKQLEEAVILLVAGAQAKIDLLKDGKSKTI